MNPVLLGVAGVFLVIGLATLFWGVVKRAAGQRHTVLVMTWLCMALTATLVVFSFFPATKAEGTVFGVSLGGAGAFVMLVWTSAIRAGGKAEARDVHDAEIEQRDREIARLTDQLAGLAAQRASTVVPGCRKYGYQLRAHGHRVVGVIAGDLLLVTDVDVWVNSENTDMEMSRLYERSLSAVIRYAGARHDGVGHVVDDCVRSELVAKVGDGAPVMAGTAIVTGPGELVRRNNVKYLVHVAAVAGEPGYGYRQIANVALCARNALAAAEQLPDVTSVVLPLFGAGAAGADTEATVRAIGEAVVAHLTRAATRIRAAYLLAYTDAELAACAALLDSMPDLRPRSR